MNIKKLKVEKKQVQENEKSSGRVPNLLYFLIALIIILQGSILYLLIRPIDLISDYRVSTIVNEVLGKVTSPPGEVPVVFRIGDGSTLPDIKELQELSVFTKEVYKDAKNGDFVLGFTEKLVIYRRDDGLIIYDGKNPVALENESREQVRNIATTIRDKGIKEGILDPEIRDNPVLERIDNEKELKENNPALFDKAQDGDIIATFEGNRKSIIYREETSEIIGYSNIIVNLVPGDEANDIDSKPTLENKENDN